MLQKNGERDLETIGQGHGLYCYTHSFNAHWLIHNGIRATYTVDWSL